MPAPWKFQLDGLPALDGRIVDSDETGVTVEAICPYCGEPHHHLLGEEGLHRLTSGCDQGDYYLDVLTPGKPPLKSPKFD